MGRNSWEVTKPHRLQDHAQQFSVLLCGIETHKCVPILELIVCLRPEWRRGHKYSGLETYPDGSFYEGTMTGMDSTYRNDVWDGQGTYVNHPENRRYVGGWKDGLKDGLGTLTQGDGREYSGEWGSGMQNGDDNQILAGWLV